MEKALSHISTTAWCVDIFFLFMHCLVLFSLANLHIMRAKWSTFINNKLPKQQIVEWNLCVCVSVCGLCLCTCVCCSSYHDCRFVVERSPRRPMPTRKAMTWAGCFENSCNWIRTQVLLESGSIYRAMDQKMVRIILVNILIYGLLGSHCGASRGQG